MSSFTFKLLFIFKKTKQLTKKFFFLLLHSLHKVKFFFLYLFTLLAIIPQKSQHFGSWWMWLSFSFHLPSLLGFWVNSRFTLYVLGIHWIIFSVRPVIDCLRWMWTGTRRRTGAWIKCKSCLTLALSPMHCSISLWNFQVLCALPVWLLLSSISFCFVSSFFHFLRHCSPVTFISTRLLNSTAILSNTPFFGLFPCPMRPLNFR